MPVTEEVICSTVVAMLDKALQPFQDQLHFREWARVVKLLLCNCSACTMKMKINENWPIFRHSWAKFNLVQNQALSVSFFFEKMVLNF